MQNQNPKSQSIASRLPITRGEKAGSGHFYLAQNRTFLLCVDIGCGKEWNSRRCKFLVRMGPVPRKRKNQEARSANPPAVAPPAPLEKPKRRWLPLAILLGMAFLTYANALRDGFVADDNLQILRNPFVTDYHYISSLFGTDVWGFAAAGSSNYYRPLQLFVYALEYLVYGNRPWIWHLFNLLVNLGVVAAAYFLVVELADLTLAFWTSLVFALHPMHVEAVVWVAALPDLLCGFLLLLAMLSYHKARMARGWESIGLYAMALAAFAVATLTKETSLLFPLVLLSYEFFYRQTPLLKLWESLSRLLPYAAVIFGYILMRLNALGSFAPNPIHYTLLSPGQLAIAIPTLIARYLGKLLLPLRYNYFYFTPPITSLTIVSAAAISITAALVAAMFLLRKRQPLLALGLAWFFLMLAPALDINAIGQNYFTERYLYIPSFGIAILAAWAWLWLLRKVGTGTGRWAAYGGVALVLVFFLVQIERRIPVFRDDLRLFQVTVLASPDSAQVQASLASAYHEAGDIPASIEHGTLAVSLDPNYPLAQINLGNSFVESGNYAEGIKYLKMAIAQKSDYVPIWVSLAKAYVGEHEWRGAEKCYQRAAQLDPTQASYYEHLADTAASGAQGQEEIARLRGAVSQHPESLDDWNELGRAYARLSQWDDAISCFQEILKRKPGDVPALLELSVAAQAKGDFAVAISAGQNALSIRPEDSGLRMNLASADYGAGRFDDSISMLNELLRRDPNFAHADEAHFMLGLDYEKRSEWAAAAEQYRQALQANPQLTLAQQHLDAIQSHLPGR
jgi:protein O-mannosyl-transferase